MTNTTVTTHRTPHKITNLKSELLTDLIPYGSFILTCSIIGIVLISNILERWALRRLYGKTYEELEQPGNERRRRSFTYFHIGAMIMFMLICVAGYPVLSFIAGPAEFSTTFGRKSHGVRIGDLLFIFSEVYSGYYIFELCFRTQFASYISIAHHIGLLIITQTALTLFANQKHLQEATLEFYMCMVWGTFDVVVELPIYVSMIIWRFKRDNHQLLSHMAYGCAMWGAGAAVIETAITIFLLNRSWALWGLVWRIVTPLIFSLWISTQLYSASRLFQMGRAEQHKHRKEQLGIDFGDSATAELGKAAIETVTGHDLTKQSAAYVRT